MKLDPTLLLSFNGGLQIVVSSLLGFFMLVPMQPWGRGLAGKVDMKALLAAHLDWIMLAFMQLAAAFIMRSWSATSSTGVAWLLVLGGWLNPTPYLLRGTGINAFVLAGPLKQRIAATIAGASALSILVAWIVLLLRLAPLLAG
jgi:hypothetical protein